MRRGGNNAIDGGAGNDTLSGGPGNDTLVGGQTNPSIANPPDTLDFTDATAGVNVDYKKSPYSPVNYIGTATGGAGTDSFSGTFKVINASHFNDVVSVSNVGSITVTVNAGGGNDFVRQDGGFAVLDCGVGADVVQVLHVTFPSLLNCETRL